MRQGELKYFTFVSLDVAHKTRLEQCDLGIIYLLVYCVYFTMYMKVFQGSS